MYQQVIVDRIHQARSLHPNQRGEYIKALGEGNIARSPHEELAGNYLETSPSLPSPRHPLKTPRKVTEKSVVDTVVDKKEGEMVEKLMNEMGNKIERIVEERTRDLNNKLDDLQKVRIYSSQYYDFS